MSFGLIDDGLLDFVGRFHEGLTFGSTATVLTPDPDAVDSTGDPIPDAPPIEGATYPCRAMKSQGKDAELAAVQHVVNPWTVTLPRRAVGQIPSSAQLRIAHRTGLTFVVAVHSSLLSDFHTATRFLCSGIEDGV